MRTVTLPPCPWWCSSPPGHDYDETIVPDEVAHRVHESNGKGDVTADVVGMGVAVAPGLPEVVTVEGISVRLHDEYLDAMTAADARALAMRLGDAADLLERIEADGA